MTACPERDDLWLVIDQEAAPELAAHVAVCRPCQEAVTALRALGGCELIECIGKGGFGKVYKARQVSCGNREVAVKVMAGAVRGDELARFRREAQIIGGLSHPHIVDLYHADRTADGRPFLVMELLPGPTVSALRAPEGGLPVGAACEVVRQAALGLQHAHESGAVHRDVTPRNLMFDRRGTVKLLDFGLARDTRTGATGGLTMSRTVLGTPHYMAPEQANAKSVDARADLYSLGCVLFYLLTGRPPFGADSDDYIEVLLAHRTAPRPDVREVRSDIPEALATLLIDLLSADRDQRRPEAAAELARQLEAWADRAALEGLLRPRVIEAAPAPSGKLPPTVDSWPPAILNSIGMLLARVPAGRFVMGSPKGEEGSNDDEGPQHEVQITRPFYLGAHQVTQREFLEVVGYNPSYFSKDGTAAPGATYRQSKPGGGKVKVAGLDTSSFPVENVSWDEAVEFCRRLTERERKEEKIGADQEYRLPTEAQWEYSCRGGTSSSPPFHFGDALSPEQANFDGHLGRTEQVGRYPPNAWGLYDMHGNVWEWCADRYDASIYEAGPFPRIDPLGPPEGSFRVVRGGSWYNDGRCCRSANRNGYGPVLRQNDLGFRVILVPSGR